MSHKHAHKSKHNYTNLKLYSPEMCSPGLSSILPATMFVAVNCWLHPPRVTRMTEVWSLSPECMDAVDHSGHVLLVIDVCGLWEEGLEGKQAVSATGNL